MLIVLEQLLHKIKANRPKRCVVNEEGEGTVVQYSSPHFNQQRGQFIKPQVLLVQYFPFLNNCQVNMMTKGSMKTSRNRDADAK